MDVTVGSRLGAYEVRTLLGEGGMGRVFRAFDTALHRDVAIKVLPESVAADPDRLMRFDREAKTLAALNHPHIAQIYGLERLSSAFALVMELVDGETLAERIARGTIAVDDALGIATQIADALHAAHEAGIVHRDLKPANVKIRHDGTVKVLDFGLAKTLVSEEREPAATITSPAMTVQGMILGTAAYMSPEQAKGKPVDRRADIWAFACVVYEMLTGKRAFEGDGVTDTIGAVLYKEPDWSALDPNLPPRIKVVLQRCLQKDPRQRVHDIADVRLAMAGAFDAPAASAAVAPTLSSTTTPGWRYTFVAAAGIGIGTLVGGGLSTVWDAAPTPPDPVRVVLTTADDPALKISPNALDVAISRDGRRVVYATWAAGGGLTARALNQLQPAVLLEDREGSINPFLSPDGAWLAFNDLLAKTVEKLPIEGGPAITIFRHDMPLRGASWADDGTIVFGDYGPGGLFQLSEGAREPQMLTTPDRQKAEADHRWPHVLPGSRAVLFTRLIDGEAPRSEIALLDRHTGEQRVLIPEGTSPQYSPSGHLVYGVDTTLRAVGFDLSTFQIRGTPVPVLEGVVSKPQGGVNFSLSPNGSLAYIMAPAGAQRARPVWVSRTGREEGALSSEDLSALEYPRISPDGRRLALIISGDVWIYELNGAPPVRLTSRGEYLSPTWSADGRRIIVEHSTVGLAAIAADGSEQTTTAISVAGHFHPVALSRDGRALAVEVDRLTGRDSRSTDIVSWHIDKPDVREEVVALPGNDGGEGATVSPDGRWLAYVSHQTGQMEIWVRPYSGPGAPIRVSPNSGAEPVWSRRGDELYYVEGRRVMAVPVSLGAAFAFKPPTFLFESRYLLSPQPPSYDVAADGRFLMIKAAASQTRTSAQVVVVLNWAEELRRRVPTR